MPTPTPNFVGYVANFADDTVTVIDARRNVVIGTIPLRQPTARRGVQPQNVAVSPDGCFAYVANVGAIGPSLAVISTADNRVANTTDPLVPNNGGTFGLAVNPSGPSRGVSYVTNVFEDVLFRINSPSCFRPGADCVVATTRGFNDPYAVAVSPDGRLVYVTNASAATLNVFDADGTLECRARIDAGPAHGVAVSATGLVLVVNTRAQALSVIDPSTCIVPASGCATIVEDCARTVPVGAGGEAVAVIPNLDPDAQIAYVTNRNDRSVSIVNVGTAATTTVELGGRPYGIAVRPDGRYAYVTGTDSAEQGVVWVIDTATSTVLPTPLAVGAQPRGIAVGAIAPPDCRCVFDSAQ